MSASHNKPATDLNEVTLHYLDVIFRLTQNGEPANTTDIAARLEVTPSGASLMLKRLADRKLVQLTPYHGAILTAAGRKAALRTIRRHRILEAFMHDIMKFEWHQVDTHAHALETAINEEFEDQMDLLLNHPIRCPHGHLIPDKHGVLPKVNDVPLLKQNAGATGYIRLVDTDNSDWLKYLGDQGIRPGARFTLKDIAPYGGPITLETSSGAHSLGRNLADLISVELE